MRCSPVTRAVPGAPDDARAWSASRPHADHAAARARARRSQEREQQLGGAPAELAVVAVERRDRGVDQVGVDRLVERHQRDVAGHAAAVRAQAAQHARGEGVDAARRSRSAGAAGPACVRAVRAPRPRRLDAGGRARTPAEAAARRARRPRGRPRAARGPRRARGRAPLAEASGGPRRRSGGARGRRRDARPAAATPRSLSIATAPGRLGRHVVEEDRRTPMSS